VAILAGQKIRALDFAGYASVFSSTDEPAFNTQTFVPGANPVGLTFMAPSSGSVLVRWHARMRLIVAAAARVLVAPETREGAVIGAGTIVQTITEDAALELGSPGAANGQLEAGMFRDINGLTPGATYNVLLMHKNANSAGGAAQVFARSIYVTPMHV
jgi:hypothetical protein